MMKKVLILAAVVTGMMVMDSAAEAQWGRRGWRGGRGFFGPRVSVRIGPGIRPYRGFYGAPVGYYAPVGPVGPVYGAPAYYGGPVYGGYYGGGYYPGYCY